MGMNLRLSVHNFKTSMLEVVIFISLGMLGMCCSGWDMVYQINLAHYYHNFIFCKQIPLMGMYFWLSKSQLKSFTKLVFV